MQGCGNDYIIVDCRKEQKIEQPEELAKNMSRAHFGVGSDGLILLKEYGADVVFMEMYNADGSRGQMCGNGMRCAAKYIYETKWVEQPTFFVACDNHSYPIWVKTIGEKVRSVRIGMGKPIVKRSIALEEERLFPISIGNNHGVLIREELPNQEELFCISEKIRKMEQFSEGINVEVATVKSIHRIEMVVWERGSGPTLACGTGACAVAIACVQQGFCREWCWVQMLGGCVLVEYEERKEEVYLSGDANYVFKGEIVI